MVSNSKLFKFPILSVFEVPVLPSKNVHLKLDTWTKWNQALNPVQMYCKSLVYTLISLHFRLKVMMVAEFRRTQE